MRTLLTFAVFLASLSAQAAPASPESIENLLTATKAEAIIDSMYSGMEQMMRQGMSQAVQGQPLSPKQQRILDQLPTRYLDLIRGELDWQKLKPLYVQLYRDTFEQEEVDGMLAFYASPAGQALVAKMPVVMQKSMSLSQSLMDSLMPKMTAAMKDAIAELQRSE